MLTQTDRSLRLTNNFPFKYRHRKKIKAWKTECEDEWLGNLCKALKTKH